jgi:hypothetical protein
MPSHIRRSQACPARTAPGGGRSGLKVEAAWRPRPASPGGRLDTPGPGRVRRGSSCRIALTVMVLETGLPTSYYLNLTEINSKPLVASNTVTACPTRAPPADTGRSTSAAPYTKTSPGLMTSQPVSSAHRRSSRLLQRKGRPVPLRPVAPPAQDTPCRIGQLAGQVSATARQRRHAACGRTRRIVYRGDRGVHHQSVVSA